VLDRMPVNRAVESNAWRGNGPTGGVVDIWTHGHHRIFGEIQIVKVLSWRVKYLELDHRTPIPVNLIDARRPLLRCGQNFHAIMSKITKAAFTQPLLHFNKRAGPSPPVNNFPRLPTSSDGANNAALHRVDQEADKFRGADGEK